MNCQKCGYALWNLRTHVCPECGEAFDPRDFEFVPASVRFCCPHCNQSYYGTSAKGHLMPEAFECVECGQPISMAEMVVLPAEGVTERETTPLIVPWIERHKVGMVRCWFKTIGWGFAYGPQIGRGLESTTHPWQAIGFAAVTLFLTLLCLMLPLLLLLVVGAFARGGGPVPAMGGMLWGPSLLCILLALGLFIALGPGSVIAHGVLRVLGAGSGRLGRTVEAVNYSCGSMVMMGVPCLGFYLAPVGWIWWMISASLALADAHRTRVWKCVLAMVLPALLGPITVIGVYGLLIVSMVGGFSGRTSLVAQAQGQVSVSSFVMSWRTKSAGASNIQPMHASELLGSGYLDGSAFFTANSVLTPADVPVGSLTLADFVSQASAFTPEQAAAVAEASAALPANTIAHRVGDFVFTYHGIDQTTAPQDLWVVVADPVRDATAPPGPSDFYSVGKVNGGTAFILGPDFAAELITQNVLRAGYGLAPLPMPDAVTQAQPAVGPEK